MENLETLEFHIQYTILRIEEFSALLEFLKQRRKNIIAEQRMHEVSSQIQTEKLMKRMKNDRSHS
jgi:hypothetical protein